MHVAAKHNHIDILQLLLEINPEALNSEAARGYKDRQVKQGLTPLMVAAGNGNARAVKELASRHAAVNDTLENGNTALLLAAAHGHSAALKELLKLPMPLAVDLDTKDHNGTLPCRLQWPVCCSTGLPGVPARWCPCYGANGDAALCASDSSGCRCKDLHAIDACMSNIWFPAALDIAFPFGKPRKQATACSSRCFAACHAAAPLTTCQQRFCTTSV